MTRSKEHSSAVRRLKAGVAERDRLSHRYEAAIGTPTERGARVELGTADDRVAARQAWLHWVDDQGYRGLNAGPFELLAESAAPLDNKELG
jgi:hypothetical protein